MKLLLIGNGRWAQIYKKVFENSSIDYAVSTYDWRSQLNCCDAAVVCTPPKSHIEIAAELLSRSIPVMIEKPLALSLHEAKRLKVYHNNIILINNIHLFSDAFKKLREVVIAEGIKKIISVGHNDGPIRDYSTLLDYGSHDIAMSLYLLRTGGTVQYCKKQLGARPLSYLYEGNIMFGDVEHKFLVGNGATSKARKFEITTCAGNRLLYDDLTKEKLFVNEKPVLEAWNPPLDAAVATFISAVKRGSAPDERFGLKISLKALAILDKCEKYAVQI